MKPFHRDSPSIVRAASKRRWAVALLLLAWAFRASVAWAAAPAVSPTKAGTADPAVLTPTDWASWPEVSIPTVAEVQATCFEVERQCRRSGTAPSLCAKEKSACLSPSTL
jgi:hypothetical protein